MNTANEEIVRRRISEIHRGDVKQLEVIFSLANRILVEAPAGYGKTSTMISKVAYLLATKQLPCPKKILALTFSVNAAYKIKKEVSVHLPNLLKDTTVDLSIVNSVHVTNYHGFCRSILKKYGKKIHQSLANIELLQTIDDFSIQGIQEAIPSMPYKEASFLSDYNTAVRENKVPFLKNNIVKYCDVLNEYLLNAGFITHNGVIILVMRLFNLFPDVRSFYQKYLSCILIDEFQDTNQLSYWLVMYLVTEKTRLLVLGDSLQRIYGFIGAIPNVLNKVQEQLGLIKITLDVNYRFASNEKMLLLDNNIRKNAESPSSPDIEKEVHIDLVIAKNQNEEAHYVMRTALYLLSKDENARIVVLCKQRGANTSAIINVFKDNSIDYFYGLFSDEDKFYTKFNKTCKAEFVSLMSSGSKVNKKMANAHVSQLAELYKESSDPARDALLSLLNAFWLKLFMEYSFLSNDEKTNLIKDAFEHNGLKQYIEHLNSKIVFSTVHAAKGLEWDYVLLPDMEQDAFPNWNGLCGPCRHKSTCVLIIDSTNETKFLEELSVFYVAVTRARRQVYFSASETAASSKNDLERAKKLSCFLSLKGTKLLLSSATKVL